MRTGCKEPIGEMPLDGDRKIVFRRLCDNELHRLKDFYESLDIDTIHRRFLAAIRDFTWLPKFLKGGNAVVVVAELDGEIVGSAEAVPTGEPGEAEVGIVVKREYRRRGIGKRLGLALYLAAREAGIKRAIAEVSPENAPALALARALGFRRAPSPPGTVRLVLDMD